MMSTAFDHDHDDDHDRGLAFDVQTLINRRRALVVLAGVGATALVGCTVQNGTTSSATATAAADADCVKIPEETAGPFPGDGTSGPNVLTESGIVRSDITSSFGSSSGVAEGVPLTINLTIVDLADGCTPMTGAAVYLWHCNRDGEYSLYGQSVSDQNYLRGVQETDANGLARFMSIFPAAYSGRWPHIHFEVYSSLAEATSARNISATSQIALPEDVCELVYATDGYSQSVSNIARTSLQQDMVFGDDGGVSQLATMSGTVDSGLTAALSVAV